VDASDEEEDMTDAAEFDETGAVDEDDEADWDADGEGRTRR
jgi:uncharacterized membrane-anchored protein